MLLLLLLLFRRCDHVKTNPQLFSRAMIEATLCYSVANDFFMCNHFIVNVRHETTMFAHPVLHPMGVYALVVCLFIMHT
jgi:hypothetical protein